MNKIEKVLNKFSIKYKKEGNDIILTKKIVKCSTVKELNNTVLAEYRLYDFDDELELFKLDIISKNKVIFDDEKEKYVLYTSFIECLVEDFNEGNDSSKSIIFDEFI